MIPQAGSAYAYSYATLGELVAWIIGWDLILEYAVGNVAVAISWGDYFTTLLRDFGVALPVWLTTGYRTALLSSDPQVHGLLTSAPHIAGIPILIHLPAFSIVMLITWLLLRGARESATANNIMVVIKLMALALFVAVGATHLHTENYHAVRAERLPRHSSGRGDRVLRLHRLRRDLDGGGGDQESAAQPADRHPRRAGDLHADLRDRRLRADRHGAVQGARGRRSAGARARAVRVHDRQLDRRARRGGLDVGGAAGVSVRPAAHLLRDGARRPAAEVGRAPEPDHQGAVDDHDHHRAVRGARGRWSATPARPTI